MALERLTVFSPCRSYRYTLWRQLDFFSDSFAMVVGLNPSTADELNDDPTIRRCVDFAKRLGVSALCMTNAFAFRATDPDVMLAHPAPVGADNDRWLEAVAAEARYVIAAWGVHGAHLGRHEVLTEMFPNALCWGITKGGFPRHPLYLAKDSPMVALNSGGRARPPANEHPAPMPPTSL